MGTFIFIIILAIVFYVIYKVIFAIGEVSGDVKSHGGMSSKYRTLLNYILSGHKDAKIFSESSTYICAGIANYGGKTIFHIQQLTGNKVSIQYEIKDNPVISAFKLEWTFPDDMDQNDIADILDKEIQNRTILEMSKYKNIQTFNKKQF